MSKQPIVHLGGTAVLVTGGTSGIGAAMAAALAAAGARVALTGRDPSRAEEIARDISRGTFGQDGRGAVVRHDETDTPHEVIGLGMDVRDEASVERGVAQAKRAFGGLDMLVNNAGIGMRTVNARFLDDPRPFWETSLPQWRDVLETNVTGYFLVARHVAPGLLAQGNGRIVNISINEETMRRKGFVPYGPSRAATDALSRVMAADLQGSGVTVNLLLPGGATATGMIPEPFPSNARRRLLHPGVMGPPIVYLASALAHDVHDQRIVATTFQEWLQARSIEDNPGTAP